MLLLFRTIPIVVSSTNVIFLKPLWGIGNRLRTIRKAYALAKQTGRELIILEHVDDGLSVSMRKLFGVRVGHMPFIVFKWLYSRRCVHFKYNTQCTLALDVREFEKVRGKNIFIEACEMNIHGVDMNDRSIYTSWSPYRDSKTEQLVNRIKSAKAKVVGVHVRQGNVNDWARGYFFNEEWRDIRKREPESSPHFCCYESKEKNLSSCTSNVQGLEGYIRKMKEYPDDTIFYVSGDRVGCVIHLHQLFPNRVISNDVEMETEHLDIYKSVQDFLSLSECDEIIVSNISSFSDEARRIRDIRVTRIENRSNTKR